MKLSTTIETMLALLIAMPGRVLAFVEDEARKAGRAFREDNWAQFSVSSALTVAGIVVVAAVTILVLAALAPTFFDATGDLSENFSTADVGDTTANNIANNVFPLIIALSGVFAIAGLAFLAFRLRR